MNFNYGQTKITITKSSKKIKNDEFYILYDDIENTIGIELNSEFFEIGIRRLGIASEYKGKSLKKEKFCKTNVKSKFVK